jgi:hypothetical protein
LDDHPEDVSDVCANVDAVRVLAQEQPDEQLEMVPVATVTLLTLGDLCFLVRVNEAAKTYSSREVGSDMS